MQREQVYGVDGRARRGVVAGEDELLHLRHGELLEPGVHDYRCRFAAVVGVGAGATEDARCSDK